MGPVLARLGQRGATAANLYSNTLTRIAQASIHGPKPVAAEPVLWARDMMALAAMHDLPCVLIPGGVTLLAEEGEEEEEKGR